RPRPSFPSRRSSDLLSCLLEVVLTVDLLPYEPGLIKRVIIFTCFWCLAEPSQRRRFVIDVRVGARGNVLMVGHLPVALVGGNMRDRKSTRLNSSHVK